MAEVEINEQAEEVVVRVDTTARRYDTRWRRWRRLDTCEYRTILVAQMPRVPCERHKARTISG